MFDDRTCGTAEHILGINHFYCCLSEKPTAYEGDKGDMGKGGKGDMGKGGKGDNVSHL